MKKGFPNKILGFNFGWKNLGQRGGYDGLMKDGQWLVTYTYHSFCNTKVNIGKEKETIFEFCPRCMIKTAINYEKN